MFTVKVTNGCKYQLISIEITYTCGRTSLQVSFTLCRFPSRFAPRGESERCDKYDTPTPEKHFWRWISIYPISVCITFQALMYGVLALLDRQARVVASSRVISTSDGTHVLGTWKVIYTDIISILTNFTKNQSPDALRKDAARCLVRSAQPQRVSPVTSTLD
jgi:hypothetical protein